MTLSRFLRKILGITRDSRAEIAYNASIIENSPLFDSRFYSHKYGVSVLAAAVDFISSGWRLGRDPSRYFSTSTYLQMYADVFLAGVNPLVHYINCGWREGRSPHPEFRLNRFKNAHFDVDFSKVDAASLCLALNGSYDFILSSTEEIVERIKSVSDLPSIDLVSDEVIARFDADFYTALYSDLSDEDKKQPALHYINRGWRELRDPSPYFSTEYYLLNHMTDQENIKCPLIDYVEKGGPAAMRVSRASKKVLCAGRGGYHDAMSPKIGVHFHCFYPELAEEIVEYLGNIPVEFQLVITVTSDEVKLLLERSLVFPRHAVGRDVVVVSNKGRDIRPLFLYCDKLWSEVDFILHLHSKRSPHLVFGEDWRKYVLESLLGSKDIASCVLGEFLERDDLGLLYPENYFRIKPVIAARTLQPLTQIASRIVDPTSIGSDFPASSMGWYRVAAFRKFASTLVKWDGFEEERGQLDGTFAHALEGSMPLIAKSAGFESNSFYVVNRLSR